MLFEPIECGSHVGHAIRLKRIAPHLSRRVVAVTDVHDGPVLNETAPAARLQLCCHLETNAAGRLPNEPQHHPPDCHRRGSARWRWILFRAVTTAFSLSAPHWKTGAGGGDSSRVPSGPSGTQRGPCSIVSSSPRSFPCSMRLMLTQPCARCAANAVVPTLPSARGEYFRCQACGHVWHVDAPLVTHTAYGLLSPSVHTGPTYES